MDKYIKRNHVFKPAFAPYKDVVLNNSTAFPFAVDSYYEEKNKVIKKYISNFCSMDQVVNFLESDHNTYEVLHNEIRKLYIDVDHVNYNQEQVIECISHINSQLEKYLNINVSMDKIIVLTNEPINNQYVSLHIIYNDICMDYKQQKDLIKIINENENMNIDDNVYHNNQLFRCINQTKMDKKNERGLKLCFFTFHNNITPSISDSIVSQTQHIELYKYLRPKEKTNYQCVSKTPFEIFEIILNKNYENVFMNNSGGIWCHLTKLNHQFNIYPMEKWLKLSSQLSNGTYSYEQNQAFVETIDKKNYNYENDNYLYYIMNKRLKNNIFYMKDENPQEDLICYLTKYFPKENVDFILSKINNPVVVDGKTTTDYEFMCDNKSYVFNITSCFITSENFTINYYYDTIKPIEYKNIIHIDTINDAKNKLQLFMENNDKLFVLKSSWGTGKTHNILKTLLKRYRDCSILIITSVNSLNMVNTSELNEYLKSVNANDIFTSHLETQKNSGVVLSKCNKVVCSIQSLTKIKDTQFTAVIMDEFESIMNGYFGYTTFKSSVESTFNVLKTILQRSDKIVAMDADISEPKINLIVDMLGENVPYNVYKNDTLSFRGVKFNIFYDNEYEDFVYYVLQDALKNHKLVFPCATRTKAKQILYMLGNTMQENSKIEKKYSEIIKKYYDSIKQKIILYIDKDGCMLYKTNGEYHVGTKIKNEDVYKNVDNFLSENQVDYFIYTPTITTGISINKPYFHKCYSVSSNNSINFLEYLQMIMRTRKFILNEVFIWIPPHLFTRSKQIKITDVMNSHRTRITLLNEFMTQDNEELKNIKSITDDILSTIEDMKNNCIDKLTTDYYCKTQLINMTNICNTKKNFVFNLMQTIIYHKLDYQFINQKCELQIKEIEEQTKSIELGLNELLMEDIEYTKWINVPIIPFKEYFIELFREEQTKSKQKPKLDNMDQLSIYFEAPTNDDIKLESYKKTKSLFNLFKVDCLKNDVIQLAYDNIHNQYTLESLQMYHDKTQIYFTYDDGTIGNSLLDSCDSLIETLIKKYNLYFIWDTYIRTNKIYDVLKIRGYVKYDVPFTISHMNFTDFDKSRLDKKVLKIICDTFEIDLLNPKMIELSNKELFTKFKELQTNLQTLFHYIKDTAPEILVKEDAIFKKEMTKFMKERLKFIDYNMKYQDTKHTTRPTDLLDIAPRKFFGKDYIIDYEREIDTTDYRFPHLEHEPRFTFQSIYKDVSIMEYDEYNNLKMKLEKPKQTRLSKKVSQSMNLTMLMCEDINGSLVYRFFNEAISLQTIFKEYYYNELYYRNYDPSDTHTTIEFWNKKKYKVVQDYKINHRDIITYSPVHNETNEIIEYVKNDELKTISRPYIINDNKKLAIQKKVSHYKKHDNPLLQKALDNLFRNSDMKLMKHQMLNGNNKVQLGKVKL